MESLLIREILKIKILLWKQLKDSFYSSNHCQARSKPTLNLWRFVCWVSHQIIPIFDSIKWWIHLMVFVFICQDANYPVQATENCADYKQHQVIGISRFYFINKILEDGQEGKKCLKSIENFKRFVQLWFFGVASFLVVSPFSVVPLFPTGSLKAWLESGAQAIPIQRISG